MTLIGLTELLGVFLDIFSLDHILVSGLKHNFSTV